MEQEFELPVEHNGQQVMLKASLLVTGYTHKFSVEVDEQIIIFEPDEERNYRAVINYDDIAKTILFLQSLAVRPVSSSISFSSVTFLLFINR